MQFGGCGGGMGNGMGGGGGGAQGDAGGSMPPRGADVPLSEAEFKAMQEQLVAKRKREEVEPLAPGGDGDGAQRQRTQ